MSSNFATIESVVISQSTWHPNSRRQAFSAVHISSNLIPRRASQASSRIFQIISLSLSCTNFSLCLSHKLLRATDVWSSIFLSIPSVHIILHRLALLTGGPCPTPLHVQDLAAPFEPQPPKLSTFSRGPPPFLLFSTQA